MIGIDAENAPLISAKTGLNVHEVLEQIVQQIPSPVGDPDAPLQALIFVPSTILTRELLYSAVSRKVLSKKVHRCL